MTNRNKNSGCPSDAHGGMASESEEMEEPREAQLPARIRGGRAGDNNASVGLGTGMRLQDWNKERDDEIASPI